jgi:hypothetical protein
LMPTDNAHDQQRQARSTIRWNEALASLETDSALEQWRAANTGSGHKLAVDLRSMRGRHHALYDLDILGFSCVYPPCRATLGCGGAHVASIFVKCWARTLLEIICNDAGDASPKVFGILTFSRRQSHTPNRLRNRPELCTSGIVCDLWACLQLGAMPLSVSSLIAFAFFDKGASPMPRNTFGALLNWMLS